MRGAPALFLRDWGVDSPWWATAQVGRWLALRLQFRKVGGGACCRMDAREPGRESGSGGGGGRGEGDILPARAAPGGEAMEVRGEASYSGGIARRGGREGSR